MVLEEKGVCTLIARFPASLLLLIICCVFARGDGLLFEYTADVLPTDPSSGWEIFNGCEFCTASIDEGKLVLFWDTSGDIVDYTRTITSATGISPPSLWVEWRFWSDTAFEGNPGCDGGFIIDYKSIQDLIDMLGDTVVGGGGSFAMLGLPFEFRTYRFESRDGNNFCYYVDGVEFFCREETVGKSPGERVKMIGEGGCAPLPTTNKWDFLRYGTISDGELIVGSDPPAGEVDANTYPDLDRFIVTFDQPAYVLVDQISVSVTGGIAPVVIKTRRLDNGPADVVEIVLDRPIPFGETTTFTFDDGTATSILSYNYISSGACCFDDGACIDDTDCISQGGSFVPDVSCEPSRACCFDDGVCLDLSPACCQLADGTPLPADTFCEGDLDSDNVDAQCGDACPSDTFKTDSGECGCGTPETDSDGDTVPNCIDQCDGQDDTRDFDNNNIPDCVEFFPIPALSEWGLLALSLLLLIGGKLYGIRQRFATK